MEHTEYYQLSLWEQDDRILREDFNSDNAKIDAALAGKADASVVPRIVHGSYTGDGNASRVISLPFAPKLMIIFGHVLNNRAIVFLTPEINAYTANSEVGIDQAMTNPYCCYLDGAALKFRNADWGNKSGNTVYYVLIG